jgi:hypothetical protein
MEGLGVTTVDVVAVVAGGEVVSSLAALEEDIRLLFDVGYGSAISRAFVFLVGRLMPFLLGRTLDPSLLSHPVTR